MLLTEYDEQAVMQAIAKDAEERGEKRGIAIGEVQGEKRGIAIGENRGETRGEEKLGALITSMMQAREKQDAIARVSADPAYRKKMYDKYKIGQPQD